QAAISSRSAWARRSAWRARSRPSRSCAPERPRRCPRASPSRRRSEPERGGHSPPSSRAEAPATASAPPGIANGCRGPTAKPMDQADAARRDRGDVALSEPAEETPDRDGAYPRLTEDQLSRLEALGERRPAEAGEVLFKEGDESYDFYVVLDGMVSVVDG